jgi:uncharacterized protein
MNKEIPTTIDKYVIPQRRQNKAIDAERTRDTVKSQDRKSQEITRQNNHSPFFSSHASLRQKQRNISNTHIDKAIERGEKLLSGESTIHLDESTQVVLGKRGDVLTVNNNMRNARFDLLQTSKERERKLLKEIELNNNDHAMCELAEIYLSGDLGNREVQKAYELLLNAAEKRNSHAMCLIARLHEEGDLGAVDLIKAQEWLEKAAERNNRYALAILGQRLLHEYLKVNNKGDGDKKALLQKAMGYLQRSAAKGGTRAMWQIGQIYEEGWTGEKNLTKAIEQYSKAANLGSPTSLQSLQRLVTEKKFSPEAFEVILEKASQLIAKTSSGLAVEIGLAQIRGELGTRPARGIEMLVQAAKKNNEDAILALAKCYRQGIGCILDLDHSRYWFNQLRILYEKAIELGNINAMLQLGDLYLSGAFGKIDFENAVKLFIRAANSGDIVSMCYLGQLYIEGRLGDHELSDGTPWVNKAIMLWSELALKGDIEAIQALADVYLDKQLGFKDYQKAARWLSFLAAKGNTRALSDLLSLYLKRKINLKNDNLHQILSNDVVILIKKKATEAVHPRAVLVLAQLRQEGYLPQEGNDESIKLLLKNLQEATKKLCLTSFLPSARQDLKLMLKHPHWNEDERKYILAGLHEYENQAEKKSPYMIGRLLGDVYSKGKLVDRNVKQAFDWYETAANLGNTKAMHRLGLLLLTGELGTVETDTAIKWFELAAQKGNQKAIRELTKLGKSKDPKLELENKDNLITETSDNEIDVKAKSYYMLGQQYRDKDPVQAAYWLRKAAKRNHTEAAFELAQLYNSGQLGKNVRAVAVRFFKSAAKSNHLGAMKALIDVYSKGDIIKADSQQVAKWQKRIGMGY